MSRPLIMKIAVLGLAWTAMIAHAQDKPADFASQTPLTLSGEGPWFRLELPLAVQLNARQPDLSDLRVFNAQGQAMAYAFAREPAQVEAEPEPVAVKWFPLYSAADSDDSAPGIRIQRASNGTVIEVQPQVAIEAGEEVLRGWLLDTSAVKAPLEQLLIDWSTERDGFQQFSIEASDDLQTWQAWGEGHVARLSFADEVVEQREVGLPGLNARYLRLLWRSPQGAPTLTAAHVFSARPDSPALPLTWSGQVGGNVEQPGQYVWQLPVSLPLQRVVIDIDEPNSLAPGVLYGRLDATQPWQTIGSSLLYRLPQNGEEVVQDQIQLSGQVVRQLKLEIDERGGGLGEKAPKLRFAVQATQVVFLAKDKGPFVLAVGNSMAKAANLPLGTLIPDLNPQTLATLGKAQPIAPPTANLAAPLPMSESAFDFKRLGLWAILVLGAVLLAWMAWSTLRASRPRS